MIWAADSIGLNLLLHPPSSTTNHAEWIERMPHVPCWPGYEGKENNTSTPVLEINSCFPTYYAAVEAGLEHQALS
jgi:hypothetical protein